MKNLVFILFVLTIQNSRADSVHSIVKGTEGEPHLVKFQSGAVEFIEQGEEQKLASFQSQLEKNQALSPIDNKMLPVEDPAFEPSVVPDGELKNIFDRMNPFMKRRSECSDRAHVWAWDEHQRSGIRSEKAFLMLTDTYIRRTRYKWWFHVAPMFTSASGQKMVMDHQFLDRPVTFTQWKNLLVFSKRDCVSDFRFQDYNAGADQTQDCYQKFEPMYYRIPGDIGARESGTPRTQWNTLEVGSARSRAFFKGSQQ